MEFAGHYHSVDAGGWPGADARRKSKISMLTVKWFLDYVTGANQMLGKYWIFCIAATTQ
jgi:hypothetical protein